MVSGRFDSGLSFWAIVPDRRIIMKLATQIYVYLENKNTIQKADITAEMFVLGTFIEYLVDIDQEFANKVNLRDLRAHLAHENVDGEGTDEWDVYLVLDPTMERPAMDWLEKQQEVEEPWENDWVLQ
jgi:hypothetical protein